MAELIWLGISVYAIAGVLFGMAFVWRGAGRIDPSACGAPWSFRSLILPGAIALWPVLTPRWRCALQAGGGT